MDWIEIKDVVIGLNGVFLSGLYAFYEPFFVYPTMALLVTLIWVTLGWNGAASLVAIATVLVAFVLALLIRVIRRQPLLWSVSRHSGRSFVLTVGAFAMALVTGMGVGLLW